MSLANEDLEHYIEKFRNILHKQDDYKINEIDMWSLIENLTKELDLSKENEDCLQKNLEKCLDIEHGDITTKFVSINEKCKQFEEENINMRGRVKDLQTQIDEDAKTLKNDYMRKLAELEEKWKYEVVVLREKFENERKCHETKGKQLYDELQLAHATADLRCDEIESNLKRQLVDANSKLRQTQNMTRSLQTEINRLKNQLELASNQTPSYSKPSKPEIRFQPLPITSRKTVHNYEEIESDDLEFMEAPSSPFLKNSTTLITSNTPLRRDVTPQNNYPTVFKGDVRNLTKTNTLPTNNKVRRKRKLYDPNTFYEPNVPQFSP